MATKRTKVSAFGAEVIEACRLAGRLGTARNYERTLSSFGAFIREKGWGDLPFGKVTPSLIAEYERWLIGRGLMRNSSSFYMRNLRSIFNRAAEAGAACPQHLFKDVYTGIDRTRKRAVDEEFVVRLQKMDLRWSGALAMARDLFLFSYCTRGMAFVDLAFLRKEDIGGGAIRYVRRKTGQLLTVALEPCMGLIINRYWTDSGPYVFPIITSLDPTAAYEQYRIALNYHNRKLKRLAALLGEPLSLSSYTARHTWATTARNRHIPISVISAGMGHTSEKTTQIYLAALDNSVIDSANRGIVDCLNGVRF